MTNQIRELRDLGIRRLRPVLRPYLIGVKHGISLADVDHHCNTQIKEIDDMLAALKEDDGKESATEDHARA